MLKMYAAEDNIKYKKGEFVLNILEKRGVACNASLPFGKYTIKDKWYEGIKFNYNTKTMKFKHDRKYDNFFV